MLLTTIQSRYRILLGSGSPRRKALLEQLGLQFEVRTQAIDETVPDDIPAIEAARYLARRKNQAQSLYDNDLLITADTTVIFGDVILGKPGDAKEARTLLGRLSGQQHEVITGVCLRSKTQEHSFQVSTRVSLAPLSDAEIDYYIATYEPFDKAGAYGIQEWIGMIGVRHLEGDYYNVMGLPLHALYRAFKSFL